MNTFVLDTEGKQCGLLSLWKKRRVVLCFTRHFGCMFCKQQIAGLNTIADELKKNDIGLIAISVGGDRESAKAFQEKTGFKGELYIDPDPLAPSSFEMFALLGSADTLRPSESDERGGFGDLKLKKEVFEASVRAKKAGFDSDAIDFTKASPELLRRIGGVFVLGPGNSCDFSYKAQFAGDHADLAAVVEAATGQCRDDKTNSFLYPATQAWVQRLSMDQPLPLLPTSRLPQKNKSVTTQKTSVTPSKSSKSPSFFSKTFLILAPAVCVVAAAVAYFMSAELHDDLDDFGSEEGLGLDSLVVGLVVLALVAWCLKALSVDDNPAHNEEKTSDGGDGDGGGGGGGGGDEEKFSVELLTPTDIDCLSFEAEVYCDCSFVQVTNVSTKCRSRCPSVTGEELALPPDHPPVKLSDDDLMVLSENCCYLREFLAKPHPLVGRGGPVCPFVPKSLKMNSLYLAVIRTDGPTPISVVEKAARSFITRYNTLEPREGKKSVYKAVILIFPNVPLQKASEVIDGVQARLKPEFVSKGLMIGEFHKRNNASGLRNPDFYPLRTPHPSLAVRKIVPTDLAFLSLDKDPPHIRVKFLTSYLLQFEGDTSNKAKKARDIAQASLDQAKKELKLGA